MSEPSNSVDSVPPRRSRLWVTVIAALLILLGLLYLGGYFIGPAMIRAAFQENNCDTVLSRGDLYARFYRSTDDDAAASIRECAVYTLGITQEQKGAWHDAYNAFTVYSESYPQGQFAEDVHQHLPAVLIGLAREQAEQKHHAAALAMIDRIVREYDDPNIVQEAGSLKLEVLMDWGANLRDAGHFAEAEHIFSEVEKSAQADYQRSAKLALAETYLAWTRELQAQHQFEIAKLKIDAAVSIDPNTNVKSYQSELYEQWGDYLLEQGDYANAMGLYATAAGFSADSDPAAGQEMIVGGYIRWAETLSSQHDFIGALVLLDFAQSTAVQDTVKALLEKARSDVYLAFSNSSDEQARQIMLESAKVVCRHQTGPRLPIFGLDTATPAVIVNGTEGELPENLAAATPASMHFVACVEESSKVVGATTFPIGSFLFDPNPPYSTVHVLFQAIQYSWSVSLMEAKTGREIKTTIINGGDPPPFPTTPQAIYEGARSPQYFGTKPEFTDLVNWLNAALN